MKPTIIDNISTPTTKRPNPIKFVSCLQCYTKNDNHYFYESDYDFDASSYIKIVRVAKVALYDGEFDVIACYRADSEFCELFLGYWNDGVIHS